MLGAGDLDPAVLEVRIQIAALGQAAHDLELAGLVGLVVEHLARARREVLQVLGQVAVAAAFALDADIGIAHAHRFARVHGDHHREVIGRRAHARRVGGARRGLPGGLLRGGALAGIGIDVGRGHRGGHLAVGVAGVALHLGAGLRRGVAIVVVILVVVLVLAAGLLLPLHARGLAGIQAGRGDGDGRPVVAEGFQRVGGLVLGLLQQILQPRLAQALAQRVVQRQGHADVLGHRGLGLIVLVQALDLDLVDDGRRPRQRRRQRQRGGEGKRGKDAHGGKHTQPPSCAGLRRHDGVASRRRRETPHRRSRERGNPAPCAWKSPSPLCPSAREQRASQAVLRPKAARYRPPCRSAHAADAAGPGDCRARPGSRR